MIECRKERKGRGGHPCGRDLLLLREEKEKEKEKEGMDEVRWRLLLVGFG